MSSSLARFVLGVLLLLGIGLVAVPLAFGPRKVQLEYVSAQPQPDCISIPVNDRQVTIYSEGLLKPKRVKWVDVAGSKKLHWTLEWDSAKPGAAQDYLGTSVIECGEKSVKSEKPKNTAIGDNRWPYRVIVRQCDDNNEPGAELCRQDPEVIIRRRH